MNEKEAKEYLGKISKSEIDLGDGMEETIAYRFRQYGEQISDIVSRMENMKEQFKKLSIMMDVYSELLLDYEDKRRSVDVVEKA